MQLRHTLKFWTANVQSGEWRVDSNGVSESVTIFVYDTLQDVNADSEVAEMER